MPSTPSACQQLLEWRRRLGPLPTLVSDATLDRRALQAVHRGRDVSQPPTPGYETGCGLRCCLDIIHVGLEVS